ncbi:hypothetical protein PpBr36_05487 [Pyricularia pennisetigena]|uniref:hypothetical protein n=1 Tax=Pyricularia pennisetigena TaxID=1578925 RepID=UPI0011504052|nr:hypothetical protein PpBr36_05487 [Pyricularia pennisetigena]TLS27372.1 hypothetical protein PpBr36_05487 [Pyricularia pennisetigena]
MSTLSAELIQYLHQLSYLPITRLYKTMSLQLAKVDLDMDLDLKSTIQMLDCEQDDPGVITQLLHSIPRDLLSSIAKGTVAYDVFNGGLNHHSGAFAGTYIASLSIDAAKELTRPGKWDPTIPSSARLKAFVCQVDKKNHGDLDGPLSISSDTQKLRVSQMRDSLQKRIDYALDPVGDDEQHQSPVMVGCSEKIDVHITAHATDGPLTSTTYTWALVVRILANGMNLKVVDTVLPVIIITDRDQLSLSEMLVTTLAESFVVQQGFNVIQAGGRRDKGVSQAFINQGRDHVANLIHFQDTMDKTMAQVDADCKRIKVHQIQQETREHLDSLLAREETDNAAVAELTAQVDELATRDQANMELEAKLREEIESMEKSNAYRDELSAALEMATEAIRGWLEEPN